MSVIANNKYRILANGAFLVLSIFAPLLVFPYLSRVLGQNGFGLYLSVLSFLGFLVIFCDFGFNISSAKRLALSQDDNKTRSEIILTTTLIKFILFIIASIFYVIFILNFSNYSLLLESIFPVILFLAALAMQPLWYFIGADKLILNSVLVSMGRILPLGFLFVLVRDQGDFKLAIQIQSLGMLLCCLASYFYIAFKEEISLNIPKSSVFFQYLKEDYMLFASNMLVGLYASLNAVLLGINTDFKQVATYAGIERIFKTIESVLASSGSLFFPSIARKMRDDKLSAAGHINDVVKFYLAAGAIIVACSCLFGSELLALVYGREFDSQTPVLYLFMFVPVLGATSIAWGNLGLLNLGKNTLFFKILLSGATLNILLIVFLSSKLGAIGGAIAILAATAVVSFQMKFHLNRQIGQHNNEI